MTPLLKDKKTINFPPQPPQELPSRGPSKKNIFLPLKELWLDDTYYNSEKQKLEIYWQTEGKIIIKSDRLAIFGPIDIRVHAHSLSVSYFHPLLKHILTSRKLVSRSSRSSH